MYNHFNGKNCLVVKCWGAVLESTHPIPAPIPLRSHRVHVEQLLCTAGATSAEPAAVVGDAGRCKEVGHDSDLPLVD